MATDSVGGNLRIQVGLSKLEDGKRAVSEAIHKGEGVSQSGTPEAMAREGLDVLRSALDWLEDTGHFDEAHQALDAAGRQVRTTFGCWLSFYSGRGYRQECPVALAHYRVGFSVGYAIREAECSICHMDPEDCDHINGQTYDGERCVRIIKRADLLEVSLVDRPSDPDARISSLPVPRDNIEENMPTEFYGNPVSCNRCLLDCTGMAEFKLD